MFLNFFKKYLIFLTVFFVIFINNSFAKEEIKRNYIEHKNLSIELISSVDSTSYAKDIHLGLFFKLKPGWKIYWKYPGKAGYPPTIDWSRSKVIKNLELIWPKPEKFKILGMESMGYSEEVVLPIKIDLKESNNELFFDFDIDYLTCNKICVPFNDNLILKIPHGIEKKSKHYKNIEKFIERSNYNNYSSFLTPDSLLFFIFIAFLGGVILNFMPCVFPVLSLKVYDVLCQRKNRINLKEVKRNFFANIIGILFSFFILSLLVILLKKTGHSLGWGFQFQSPVFLSFMTLILIIFSLNLINVFKIDIPNFLKNNLNRFINLNKKKSDFYQNFFLGSFITILSTPCSAPFIGTALGFAFVSSNNIIFLIFLFIGLGLSIPYIVLAINPQLLFFLPKPGIWMNKLKYFLSFLLMLTAIWLLTVLLIQTKLINKNEFKNDEWIKFNNSKINNLVDQNNIVFVDITADWCVTCFYNKKTVINRKKIKDIFKKYNVKKIRGDLTNPNEEISKYISSFNRFGIPFNIIYSPSTPQGILLSEVLTVKEVLSTFESIK